MLLTEDAPACFSYREVRQQLEQDAARAIRSEARAAGMGILERLLLADQALALRIARLTPESVSQERRSAASTSIRELSWVGAEAPRLKRLSSRRAA